MNEATLATALVGALTTVGGAMLTYLATRQRNQQEHEQKLDEHDLAARKLLSEDEQRFRDAMQAQIDRLVGQVTRLEEAGREKDKRIAELEYQLIELRSEVLAKERENVALTAEVAVLKEKIAWLTERLNYYERGGGVGGVAAGGGDGS